MSQENAAQQMDHLEVPYEEPSSDLEDSQPLWYDELGRYIMETRYKERQIEDWFEKESLVCLVDCNQHYFCLRGSGSMCQYCESTSS